MLILILSLTVQTLVMMSNRKEILDQNKKELLDSVNAANQVYTNEELSNLIEMLQEQVNDLQDQVASDKALIANLQTKHGEDFTSLNTKISQNLFHTGNGNYPSDLNDINLLSKYGVIGFIPTTKNKPSSCSYGVVLNYTNGGDYTNTALSFWHFQVALCTSDNKMYVRRNINHGEWTSWA